jgi:hypothetical protein
VIKGFVINGSLVEMRREYLRTIRLTEAECDNFSKTAENLWKRLGRKYGGVKLILPISRRYNDYNFINIGSTDVIRVEQTVTKLKDGVVFKYNPKGKRCLLQTFQTKHTGPDSGYVEDPTEEIDWDKLDLLSPSSYAFSEENFTNGTNFDIGKIKSVLNEKKSKYPGVDKTFSYIGAKGSTSNFHSEDSDLYSLNVVVVGGRKIWFFVQSEDQENFLKLVQSLNEKECVDFIRRKELMMTPEFLAENGIKVHVAVQNRYEVILTFPRGYHAVINYEYNIATAVNIASPRYLPLGRKADQCDCVKTGRDDKNCAAVVLSDEDFKLMEKSCEDNNENYSPMVFDEPEENNHYRKSVIVHTPSRFTVKIKVPPNVREVNVQTRLEEFIERIERELLAMEINHLQQKDPEKEMQCDPMRDEVQVILKQICSEVDDILRYYLFLLNHICSEMDDFELNILI